MTKSDLVEQINSNTNLTKIESYDHVESVFTIIKDTLASGENIKVTGFGNFEINQKRERNVRNPQTGESITIEARRVLTFKSSNILKDKINCVAA